MTAEEVRARNVDAVRRFLAALEALDVTAFLALWAEEGVQEMPYAPPGFPRRLEGRAAVARQYGGLPDAYASMRFPDLVLHPAVDPAVVVAEYRGEIALEGGGSYDNRYCGVFRFRPDGLLAHYTEYFDPLVLQAAFGGSLGSTFSVEEHS